MNEINSKSSRQLNKGQWHKDKKSIISILFLSSDPTDTGRLRLSAEVRDIREKLQLAKGRDNFRLDERVAIRPQDITQALLDVNPQIVHFSGHGDDSGTIFLENQTGMAHAVTPASLAALFEQFSKQIQCIVLNACYSEIQAQSISKHINYVIGMNDKIDDDAARAFSIGFYQALGAGRTIDEAYRFGCVQIGLMGIDEHQIPILVQKPVPPQISTLSVENSKTYNNKYDREIKGIAEEVDRFFLFQRMGEYQPAIGSARIIAEAIGRLVFLRSEYYKDNPEKIPGFANLIDICRKYNIISNDVILNALNILKREGNAAHHPGEKIFSNADFDICRPEVVRLTTWLFTEYLHIPIPPEIEDNLSGKKKPLPVFQSVENVMDLGTYLKLFKNNLVFFTPAEQQTIQSICTTLIDSHQALLLGHPASGKSILALTIAKKIQEQGYQAFYASFKHGIQHDLWDDIRPLLNEKILFIVDDCHLNIKDAANLYRLWHGQDTNACLLFISRQIAKEVQENAESDFYMFDELREQTYSSELIESQNIDKIKGIVLLYKNYFEEKYERSYKIGDIHKLIKQVYADLLLLSCYLDVWEMEQIVLSEIDRVRVLKNVYVRYWKFLDSDQMICLLRAASLYYFEIPFEPLPTDESSTNDLLEKGLLQRDAKQDIKLCVMYHSSFAALLIDAYLTEKALIINRQYRKTERKREGFLCSQLRDYITSFLQDYSYPLNLQIIIDQLINYPETNFVFGCNILLDLLQNNDIKQSIINYHSDINNSGNFSNIRRFFDVISSKFPNLLFELFDLIFFKNINSTKPLLLKSQHALNDYYMILNTLKQDTGKYNAFLSYLTQEEKTKMFSESSLANLATFFIVLKKNKLNQIYNEWEEYFKQVSITELAQKARQLNLGQLSGSLRYIEKKLDAEKAKAILHQIDVDWLVERAGQADLTNIGQALAGLRVVDADKTQAVLQQLDSKWLAERARQANLTNIGHALAELRTVDTDKTQAVLQQLDSKWLAERARYANLTDIGHALFEFGTVDADKAQAILQQLDLAWMVEQAKQANLTDIGHALLEFGTVDVDKAQAILQQLDLAWLVEQAKQVNINRIGHALAELRTIEAHKTRAILKQLDPIWLSQQILHENFSNIGKILANFKIVDVDIAFEISNHLSAGDLVSKIHETSYDTFLWHIPVIAQINHALTYQLFAEIDDAYLFQMKSLEKIANFNKLLFACHLSNFKEGTQRLITFAHERLNYFLASELKNVKSFLELMSNYEDISPIIENNISRMVGKILNEKDDAVISSFIGLTHKYSPERASYFLKRFQEKYPYNNEVIAFCFYYFGKNYVGSKTPKYVDGRIAFTRAQVLFTEINHEKGLARVRNALLELDKQQTE